MKFCIYAKCYLKVHTIEMSLLKRMQYRVLSVNSSTSLTECHFSFYIKSYIFVSFVFADMINLNNKKFWLKFYF